MISPAQRGGGVTLFGDFICPFSYLTFEALRRVCAELALPLAWRGLARHPDLPSSGVPAARLFADAERRAKRWEELGARAAELDLEMRPLPLLMCTRTALEAVTVDAPATSTHAFHRRLFRAAFAEHLNVGERETVMALGTSVGIDRDRLAAALDGGELARRVDDGVSEARARGIDAPPAVVSGELVLRGPQTVAALRAALAPT